MFFSNKTKIVLAFFFVSFSIGFATDYFEQDFFPIGFTGFEHTGYWSPDGVVEGCPYPATYAIGTWDKEDSLLQLTGCNFIGCADGLHIFDKNITLNYNSFKSQTL